MDQRPDETGFRQAYAIKTEHLVIGLMSGTSLDGVDAVLVRIETEAHAFKGIELLHHSYLPYSEALRSRVAALCSLTSARIDALVEAHFGLAEWYAEAVKLLLSESRRRASDIDAISLHGQTVWHAPLPTPFPGPEGEFPVKGTLQLGSSSVLRERTGIPVVADLRARDMAAGGEGAPLSPYLDALLFGSPEEGRAVQNIGGIGNVTVIPPGATMGDIFAFDTGPGNMIMDALVLRGTGGRLRFDPDGSIAAQGRVWPEMLEELMADPYFARRPPKSTGREVYGLAFTEALEARFAARGLSFEDGVATATAFTAESIARAYRDFVLPKTALGSVVACGGGARNASLLGMLEERLPKGISIKTSAEFGIPDQAREAMAFALLGHESLMGRPGNLPAVTGARAAVVLGTVTL